MSRRRGELEAAGIHQVVRFHSSGAEMLKYQAQRPIHCIADASKEHFRRFGVETSIFV
jgi:hypothetical protein